MPSMVVVNCYDAKDNYNVIHVILNKFSVLKEAATANHLKYFTKQNKKHQIQASNWLEVINELSYKTDKTFSYNKTQISKLVNNLVNYSNLENARKGLFKGYVRLGWVTLYYVKLHYLLLWYITLHYIKIG